MLRLKMVISVYWMFLERFYCVCARRASTKGTTEEEYDYGIEEENWLRQADVANN